MQLSNLALAALGALPLAYGANSSSSASATATSSAAATATSSAYTLNVTFPSTDDWWVLGIENTATWTFTPEDKTINFTILLTNPSNQSLLSLDGDVTSTDWSVDIGSWLGSSTDMGDTYANGLKYFANPGTGFVLSFRDADTDDEYGTSQAFEIKAANSTTDPSAPTVTDTSSANSTSTSNGRETVSGAHSVGLVAAAVAGVAAFVLV